MAYEIGDTVRIRSWESMVEEFGTDRLDIHIDLDDGSGIWFRSEMKSFCGKEYQICDCVTPPEGGRIRYLLEGTLWTFVDEMFEPYDEEIEETDDLLEFLDGF